MDFVEFVIARYNYWIFIVLMMTGLYTVIARGNLVKKIIGLNIFQTSVFIYYISIGKISGGTAPIYVPGDMERRTDHGDSHGNAHGGGHSGSDHGAAHNANDGLHGGDANDLAHASSPGAASPHADGGAEATAGLHEGAANPTLLADAADAARHAAEPGALEVAAIGSDAVDPDAPDHGVLDSGGVDGEFVAEVLYSNPLPHVLILTAIVVGVATTAVGLALAVRIREAYGTIEEDELETADNIAEFGRPDPRGDTALLAQTNTAAGSA